MEKKKCKVTSNKDVHPKRKMLCFEKIVVKNKDDDKKKCQKEIATGLLHFMIDEWTKRNDVLFDPINIQVSIQNLTRGELHELKQQYARNDGLYFLCGELTKSACVLDYLKENAFKFVVELRQVETIDYKPINLGGDIVYACL